MKSQHPTIKILISVGGGDKGSDDFASVAASPQKVGRFTSSLENLVEMHQFDGVDRMNEDHSFFEASHDQI